MSTERVERRDRLTSGGWKRTRWNVHLQFGGQRGIALPSHIAANHERVDRVAQTLPRQACAIGSDFHLICECCECLCVDCVVGNSIRRACEVHRRTAACGKRNGRGPCGISGVGNDNHRWRETSREARIDDVFRTVREGFGGAVRHELLTLGCIGRHRAHTRAANHTAWHEAAHKQRRVHIVFKEHGPMRGGAPLRDLIEIGPRVRNEDHLIEDRPTALERCGAQSELNRPRSFRRTSCFGCGRGLLCNRDRCARKHNRVRTQCKRRNAESQHARSVSLRQIAARESDELRHTRRALRIVPVQLTSHQARGLSSNLYRRPRIK